MHDARNLSCVTCHSVHSPKSEQAQLKTATVIETCVSCHKTEVAKTAAVRATCRCAKARWTAPSCHNPHGSTNVADAQGRQLDQRDAARAATPRSAGRSCGITRRCARPATPATIRTGRTTIACSSPSCRCSASAATSARGIRRRSTTATQLAARSNRLIGRGCVNCHSQIHGSNSPAGNTFLR